LTGITFPTLIPALRIGALFDDINAFWTVPGDEAFFQYAYVEVATVNGKVTALPPRIAGPRRLDGATTVPAAGAGPPLVAWDELWWAFSHRLQELKWRREDDPPVPSVQLADMEVLSLRRSQRLSDSIRRIVNQGVGEVPHDGRDPFL
jgi:hypothetical protein